MTLTRRARAAARPAASRRAKAATSAPRSGAQSLERALRVLREIASSGEFGRRLTDLQRSTGLTKPTLHRIARALVRQDFATFDKKSRRYFLGAEISILSVSAPEDLQNLRDLSREDMRRLAEETGDTAYLMVRSGNDVVCIARELGHYPIKALTGEIGTRRPLGVGAAGVTLLADLSEAEAETVMKANRGRLRRLPNASAKAILASVKEARSKGYGFSDGLVIRAVRGIGMPIRDRKNRTVGALSVGAIRERMTRSHVAAIVAALQRARRSIEQKLRAPARRARPTARP